MKDDIRLNNFDMMRLLAASQVVLIHSIEHLRIPLGSLGMSAYNLLSLFPGVPIFFVISGFLISMSFERNPDIRTYVRNRLLRIYPALWVCLAVSLLSVTFLGYWGRSNVSTGSLIVWLIAQVTFAQFYNPDFLRNYGVGVLNGSLWTIPVELQFYMLLPSLYFVLRRLENLYKDVIILTLIAVFAFINHQFVLSMPKYGEIIVFKLFGVTVIPYLYMFLIGVFIQRKFLILRSLLENKAIYWLALYAFSTIFLGSNFGFRTGTNHPNFITCIILAFAVISCAFSFKNSSSKILRGNDISYGTYIYHMVIVNIFVELSLYGKLVNLLLIFLFTYVVSTLSWLYIEKPALSLKKRALRPVEYQYLEDFRRNGEDTKDIKKLSLIERLLFTTKLGKK